MLVSRVWYCRSWNERLCFHCFAKSKTCIIFIMKFFCSWNICHIMMMQKNIEKKNKTQSELMTWCFVKCMWYVLNLGSFYVLAMWSNYAFLYWCIVYIAPTSFSLLSILPILLISWLVKSVYNRWFASEDLLDFMPCNNPNLSIAFLNHPVLKCSKLLLYTYDFFGVQKKNGL